MNGRRTFLRVAGIGGLATLAGATLPFRYVFAAGQADALLLSCMDYRLLDATARYMAAHGLKGKYDHVILAGASLGATTSTRVEQNLSHQDVANEPTASPRSSSPTTAIAALKQIPAKLSGPTRKWPSMSRP